MSHLPKGGSTAILVVPMRPLLSLALFLVSGSTPALAQTARRPEPARSDAALERVLDEARRAQQGTRRDARGPKPTAAPSRPPEELEQEARRHEEEQRTELLASAPRRFRVLDLDHSGWVSYREATGLLGVSKSDYRAYDTDQDGRWTAAEFAARDRALLDRLGTAAAPIPALEELQRRREALEAPPAQDRARPRLSAAPAPASRPRLPSRALSAAPAEKETASPPEARTSGTSAPKSKPARPAIPAGLRLYPSPGQLLALFDQDSSHGLSEAEVELVLAQSGNELSADLILQQTDRDKSGELELDELGALSFFVSEQLSPGLRQQVERLSRSIPGSGAVEDPSRETGPFGRLDIDRDGLLEARDLRDLAGPYAVGIRFEAVLAALDLDGDGRVDRSEFRAALRAPRRAPEDGDTPVADRAPRSDGTTGTP